MLWVCNETALLSTAEPRLSHTTVKNSFYFIIIIFWGGGGWGGGVRFAINFHIFKF